MRLRSDTDAVIAAILATIGAALLIAGTVRLVHAQYGLAAVELALACGCAAVVALVARA